MADVIVEHADKIEGDVLDFWNEAWASFVSRGVTDMTEPPLPSPMAEAWVAKLDGKIIGIQAAMPIPQSPRVNHLLSWVHPEYRGMGVWSTIADVMDANLAQRGFQFYISWVVEGEPEMLQAVLNRGGVIQQYRTRRPVIGAQ